jgi:hypothetical protein
LNKGKDVGAYGRGQNRDGIQGDKNEIILGEKKVIHLICGNTELYQDTCGLSRGKRIIYLDRAVFKSRGNHHNVDFSKIKNKNSGLNKN